MKDLDDAFDSYIQATFGRLEHFQELRELRRAFFAGCHFVACNVKGGKLYAKQTMAFMERVGEDKD